jgi:hypothetical protein
VAEAMGRGDVMRGGALEVVGAGGGASMWWAQGDGGAADGARRRTIARLAGDALGGVASGASLAVGLVD